MFTETLRLSGLRADIDDSGEFQSLRAELSGIDSADIRTQITMGAAPTWWSAACTRSPRTGSSSRHRRVGSQLAPYTAGAEQVIWVVGAQKVVPDLETALRRVRDYSLPREHDRVRETVSGVHRQGADHGARVPAGAGHGRAGPRGDRVLS